MLKPARNVKKIEKEIRIGKQIVPNKPTPFRHPGPLRQPNIARTAPRLPHTNRENFFATLVSSLLGIIGCFLAGPLYSQTPQQKERLSAELDVLQSKIDSLSAQNNIDSRHLADVQVFAKAVQWILKHDEFYTPDYVNQTHAALRSGLDRLDQLTRGKAPWARQVGKTIRGYRSRVDKSYQPYALSLPAVMDDSNSRRWPLHVVLHGRAGKMNEVNFIHKHHAKKSESDVWIQLDVFGRTNNAYRWSGETDAFEAIDDVKSRFPIDDQRIALRGFSMGGAGAWHLGLHFPDLWSSVGPGAGFVDFYKYQKQANRLPGYQHATLGIYDSIDYALNAFNVPISTYGGENDSQLVASTSMVAAAKNHDVEITLLIGKGMGHKFDPESRKAFMAFHTEKSRQGRPPTPRKSIQFTTRSPRYNKCDWIEIVEMQKPYLAATVSGQFEGSKISVTAQNVAMLRLLIEDSATIKIGMQSINKSKGPLTLVNDGNAWLIHESAAADVLRKRNRLSGPIDDAFMDAFVCVRGTGIPWSRQQNDWANWTLHRFESEFHKWLRGQIQITDDTQVTDEMIRDNNLVLFGDPGSNALVARVLDGLPIKWEPEAIEINGRRYASHRYGLSLIYPNPLNPQRYVVINSGHTFHTQDFKASNAWLFPRLGDIAIRKFSPTADGSFAEETVWADLFTSDWKLSIDE